MEFYQSVLGGTLVLNTFGQWPGEVVAGVGQDRALVSGTVIII